MTQAKKAFYEAIVNQRTPAQSDSLVPFFMNATLAGWGYEYAPEDIPLEFELDYSTWDSLNAARQEAGLPLWERVPDSIFSFPDGNAVIPRGSYYSNDIAFTISARKMPDGHNYLVPVRLKKVGAGFTLNEELSIAYYQLKLSPPVELSRRGWTIKEVSSQETVGEGPNNGLARFILDGNKATFWHTKYLDGLDQLPHHLVIDMQQPQSLLGLNITGRQGSEHGNPNIVDIQLSDDGNTWSQPITLELDNTERTQIRYFKSAQTGRYLKLTVRVTMGNTAFTYLSEVAAF